MKNRGFSHIEITMLLLGVITIFAIVIALAGQSQDYKDDKDQVEQVSRY